MHRLTPAVLLVAVLSGSPARGADAPAPAAPVPSTPEPLRLDGEAVRAFERARPGSPPAPTRAVVLTRRETPLGIEGAGPARDGDGRAGAKAFVLYGGVGSGQAKDHLLIVRGGRTWTVGGRSLDAAVRRVAVLVDGRVVVQATNGELYVAGERDLEPLGLRAQAQAQVVADAVRPVVWIGTEAGAVLRLDPTARTLDTVWPSGDPPVTALAAEDGRILVGRGEGSLEVGGAEGPPRVIARFPGSVRAVAMSGDLVAAVGPGHLAVLRLGPDGPTPVHLALVSPTRNLAFLRAGEGLPLVARCQVTREDDMGTIATPRLLVTSLDPDVAGAEMSFDPWPVPGGGPASPWTLRDVYALRPADDGRSVGIVVAAEGALRVVDVDVRPLPSGGGR